MNESEIRLIIMTIVMVVGVVISFFNDAVPYFFYGGAITVGFLGIINILIKGKR